MRTTLLILLAAPLLAATVPQESPTDLIDRLIKEKWDDAEIKPADRADDYEFFRRIHLDVVGRLPKPDEIRNFMKDIRKHKRDLAIDRLIDSQEAARHWADRWVRQLLTMRFEQADPFRVDFSSFHNWLKASYSENMPYDEFFTALVSAEGDKYKNPQSNFLVKYIVPNQPPVDMTNRITEIFLGLQLKCAQCHDHPYDRWSQEDYWGMAAFFGRLKVRTSRTFDGKKTKVVQLRPVNVQVSTIIKENRKVTPVFLDGRRPEEDKTTRKDFASYVISMEDDQFARNFVNREWAHFMGRGFVMPLEKLSRANRASHPELLKQLADDFKENGYDVKRFQKSVMRSRAYQLSCHTAKDAEPKHFAQKLIKAQGPVEFLNNFEYALDLYTFFDQFYKQFEKNPDLPEMYKTRVVFRIYLTQFVSNLLAPGGRAPEDVKNLGSVQLALKLMNSNDLQGTMKAQWGHLKRTMAKYESPEDRLEEIYLTLFSRPPAKDEKRIYLTYIKAKRGRNSAYEDVYWVLINSPDFFFNH